MNVVPHPLPEVADLDGLLRCAPFFERLDARERARILAVARPFAVAAGHTLFSQGDQADAMYLLASGAVRVTARLLGEDEVELATVRGGEIVGELGLVDRGVRTGTARAIRAATGYVFGAAAFAALRAAREPGAHRVVAEIARIVGERVGRLARPLASQPTAVAAPPPRLELADVPALVDRQLGALPLFAPLGGAERRSLLASGRAVAAAPGAVVFEAGRDADEVFVVLHGALQLAVGANRIGAVGPGRTAGLASALGAERRHFERCTSRDGALLLVVDRAALDAIATGIAPYAPALLDVFVADLIATLRTYNRRVAGLVVGGARTGRWAVAPI